AAGLGRDGDAIHAALHSGGHDAAQSIVGAAAGTGAHGEGLGAASAAPAVTGARAGASSTASQKRQRKCTGKRQSENFFHDFSSYFIRSIGLLPFRACAGFRVVGLFYYVCWMFRSHPEERAGRFLLPPLLPKVLRCGLDLLVAQADHLAVLDDDHFLGSA